MKRLLFTLMLSLLPAMVMAQQSEADIIREIERTSASIESLECDFVQTKHLKMLNDKMVSYGKMYYQHPNQLRWEYTSPYTYTFMLSGNHVLLKNAQRQDVIDVDKNKMFKEIARMMMSSVTGSSLSDSDTFDIDITTVGSEWVATLVPKRGNMKQMWKSLVLHFDRAAKSVTKVEMREHSGDTTVIELSNVRLNCAIDASMFNID